MSEERQAGQLLISLPGGRVARVPLAALEAYIDPAATLCHGPDGGDDDDVTQHSLTIDPSTGASVWHIDWELGYCTYMDENGQPQSTYAWHRHPYGSEYTELHR